jgi:hypothetical protein
MRTNCVFIYPIPNDLFGWYFGLGILKIHLRRIFQRTSDQFLLTFHQGDRQSPMARCQTPNEMGLTSMTSLFSFFTLFLLEAFLGL